MSLKKFVIYLLLMISIIPLYASEDIKINPLVYTIAFITISTLVITLLVIIFIIKNKEKILLLQMQSNNNLFSASKDILCIFTPHWTFLQVNPSFEKILAYDRFEMLHKNIVEIIPQDEKDKFNHVKSTISTKERNSFDMKLISKNGEEKWISWYCFYDKDTMKIYAAGRDVTNENMFLQQLQQSEERARKQFKSIPIPTYTWKRQGDDFILLDYNDMVYQLTEGKVQDLVGIKASDLLKNNYQVLRDMDYCYISRKPVLKEIEFFVEDSHEKKFYITSYAFVPPDSVMIHMDDITNKKITETELKDNEQKYRALFNSSTDAILLIDLNGKIIDCNLATKDLFQYSLDEIKQKEVSSLFKADQHKMIENSIISGVEELIIHLFGMDVVDGFVEVECIKKNNTKFQAETQAQFFKFKDNRIVLLYIRDITERKVMERALKESSARLKTAFENFPSDFWITDNNLQILMQSRNSIELWGNLTNTHIHEANLPDEVKNQWIKDCQLGLKGEPVIHEVHYENNPKNKIFHQMIVPIINDTVIDGLLGLNMDITEGRLKEEELRKYSADLEKVNQELKSFAYIVSHDLKAPLRAITTIVEWLVADYNEKFDDEGRNILSLLNNRTKRMHDLIDGILLYSRVGRMDVPIEEIPVSHLIKNICTMLIIPNHIKVYIQEDMPTIFAAKVYIEQIFQNLISNAVKFLDKENGLIEINCKEESDHYIFSVKDNGPGIDEKYYSKIFEIFQTLHPRDEIESTGVGLSIVKKIVDNYGGKIWLESKISLGSCFYFTFPKSKSLI